MRRRTGQRRRFERGWRARDAGRHWRRCVDGRRRSQDGSIRGKAGNHKGSCRRNIRDGPHDFGLGGVDDDGGGLAPEALVDILRPGFGPRRSRRNILLRCSVTAERKAQVGCVVGLVPVESASYRCDSPAADTGSAVEPRLWRPLVIVKGQVQRWRRGKHIASCCLGVVERQIMEDYLSKRTAARWRGRPMSGWR